MGRFDTDQEFLEHFDERYQRVMSPVMLDIEEETQGTRIGASSWSTLEQVDRMAEEMRLGPGSRLLELGCGTGWSGLHMAERTGARVTLTDLPFEAVSIAGRAARRSGADATVALADGAALPFRDGVFDAITHSDVMCCLSGKKRVLEESQRVLKPTGRVAFTALLVDEAVPDDVALEQIDQNSEFLVSDTPYGEMLGQAGFSFEVEDWTAEFLDMTGRLATARSRRLGDLEDLYGEEEAQVLIERPIWYAQVINEGMLKRRLYVATPV